MILGLAIGLLLAAEIDQESLDLPKVSFVRSKSLYNALRNRKSTREYKADTPISNQDMADLLWAAGGINRAKEGKYTVAAANGNLNVTLFVILKNGIYKYIPQENKLTLVKDGDFTKLAGKQSFAATAPLNIVYVGEYSNEQSKLYAGVHAGSMVQNVYLVAADKNLATVVRAYVDQKALAKAIELAKNQEVLLVQSVGHFL
jgi:SagB-type dehydrogenase family enzyme